MGIYSISDLAKISGIKAHTLRVWEQRYNVLTPKRTAQNVRYYDDENLRHLLNIVLLYNNEWKISKIAKLPFNELTKEVAEITNVSSLTDVSELDALSLSLLEMDETKLNQILDHKIKEIGFEQTLNQVIFPFLDRISSLWIAGSIKPVQEIFTSNIIKRKIFQLIDQLPQFPVNVKAPKLGLFLPKEESQEMSLVLFEYLARKKGIKTYYFGKDLDEQDFIDFNHITRPDLVFFMISEPLKEITIENYTKNICQIFKNSTVMLSGYQFYANVIDNIPPNGIMLPSLNAAVDFLEQKINN